MVGAPLPWRASIGFFAGLALYVVATAVNGYLAAVSVPAEFFLYFGRERAGFSLFLLNLGLHAAPLAIIALIWAWFAMLWSSDRPVRTAALCMAGYLTGVSASMTLFVLDFAASEAADKVSLQQFLMTVLLPPWWVYPAMLSIPIGIATAAWLRARVD
jgi:hypothetical protein